MRAELIVVLAAPPVSKARWLWVFDERQQFQRRQEQGLGESMRRDCFWLMHEPRDTIDGQLAVQSRLHDGKFGVGELGPFIGCCCDPLNPFREGNVDANLIHVLAGRAALGLVEEFCRVIRSSTSFHLESRLRVGANDGAFRIACYVDRRFSPFGWQRQFIYPSIYLKRKRRPEGRPLITVSLWNEWLPE